MKNIIKKLIILLVLLVHYGLALHAQTEVYFSYDNAGNRIYRGPIIITSKKSGVIEDTVTYPKQIFQENQGNSKITIYPNPTHGELKIRIEGTEETEETGAKIIYVYSLSGALLIQKNITTSEEIVDLGSYPMGTYVLRIVLSDKKFEWKIIKE